MVDHLDKSGIANRCRLERKAKDITQTELAEMIGCTQTVIVRIETGGSYSDRVVRDVATALKINDEWLRTGKGPKESADMAHRPNAHYEPPSGHWREVPVVSWATAGAAKDYTDLADFLEEKVITKCHDPNAFALIIEGDSMEPAIGAGDRVIVAPNIEAQSGDLVIARTRKDHGVYLKKFLRYGESGEKVRLVSINPSYPPMEFKLSDFRFIYPIVSATKIFKHVNGA